MEGVIGYVTGFAGNFAPKNWAFCAGQIMPISQNTALFSILGTTYGGNGTTTFGLPDLRGRAVISAGQGPGLTPRTLGEVGGTETTTMTIASMPSHVHPVSLTLTPAANGTASANTPQNDVYASPPAGQTLYGPDGSANMQAYPALITTGPTGGSQPFPILHPLSAINYIVCLYGVFPARN